MVFDSSSVKDPENVEREIDQLEQQKNDVRFHRDRERRTFPRLDLERDLEQARGGGNEKSEKNDVLRPRACKTSSRAYLHNNRGSRNAMFARVRSPLSAAVASPTCVHTATWKVAQTRLLVARPPPLSGFVKRSKAWPDGRRDFRRTILRNSIPRELCDSRINRKFLVQFISIGI